MGEITQLLERTRAGEDAAWEQAMTLLYEDLLRVARRALGGRGAATLNATALVHECYLKIAHGKPEAIADSRHFLALASRAMRQILVNHARDKLAAKRGAGAVHLPLDTLHVSAETEADDILMLDAALTRLTHEDEQLGRVVDCRIFGGLTEEETSAALQIPLRTVQRSWQQAKARLRISMQEHAADGPA